MPPHRSSSQSSHSGFISRLAVPNAQHRRLLGQLRASRSLMTFDSVRGELAPVAYPVTSEGYPLDPMHLFIHSITHKYDLPKCSCNVPVVIFRVSARKDGSPPNEYTHKCIARCGRGNSQTGCGFWVNINALLEDDTEMTYAEHAPRPRNGHVTAPAATQASAPSTPSGSVSASASTPSSEARVRRELGLQDSPNSSSGGSQSSCSSASFGSCITNRSEYSGYALAMPAVATPEHRKAFRLWTPPSPSAHLAQVRAVQYSYTTPAMGNVEALNSLNKPEGLAAKTFWGMFVACRGCDFIMVGDQFATHACDLTELD